MSIEAWQAGYLGDLRPALAQQADPEWGPAFSRTLANLVAIDSIQNSAEAATTDSLAGEVARFEDAHARLGRFDSSSVELLQQVRASPHASTFGALLPLMRWRASILFDDQPASEPDPIVCPLSAATQILRVAFRALYSERAGDLDQATKLARQASRMGRTQANPYAEHVAHLVLARIRRISGAPHLATRILAALSRIAGGVLQPWIRYELALAAGRELDATSAWRSELGAQPWARDEVLALQAMLDPEQAATFSTASWLGGETRFPPRGLHGVARLEDGPFAYVLARPDAPARRVLAPGHAKLSLDVRSTGQTRVDTGSAVLALAGDQGLSVEEFFARVWGFAYRPSIHSGALRVVLHRMREESPLDIDRDSAVLVGRADKPLLMPDPRCVHSEHDRMLWYIASHSEAAARDVAKDLGLPARTVQRGLAILVEDGFCARVGKGRATRYTVEDTTFSEPTLA